MEQWHHNSGFPSSGTKNHSANQRWHRQEWWLINYLMAVRSREAKAKKRKVVPPSPLPSLVNKERVLFMANNPVKAGW